MINLLKMFVAPRRTGSGSIIRVAQWTMNKNWKKFDLGYHHTLLETVRFLVLLTPCYSKNGEKCLLKNQGTDFYEESKEKKSKSDQK